MSNVHGQMNVDPICVKGVGATDVIRNTTVIIILFLAPTRTDFPSLKGLNAKTEHVYFHSKMVHEKLHTILHVKKNV